MYNEQIEELTKNPELIISDWARGRGLFKILGKDSREGTYYRSSGCITMIKDDPNMFKAIVRGVVNEELTEEIANDQRVPSQSDDITVESLPIFKYYQEKFDALNF
jgi:hypothetical protein